MVGLTEIGKVVPLVCSMVGLMVVQSVNQKVGWSVQKKVASMVFWSVGMLGLQLVEEMVKLRVARLEARMVEKMVSLSALKKVEKKEKWWGDLLAAPSGMMKDIYSVAMMVVQLVEMMENW